MKQKTSKSVLITGGSRGIGRATALLAASQGWSVAINYRSNREMADKTVEDIRTQGGQGYAVQADVANEEDVIKMFAESADKMGQIDVVVINAGIVAPAMPLADMTGERLRSIFDTNVMGALYCAREAARILPRATDEPSASIVFVSSIAATLGAPFEYVDYAASKGAIDSLTIGLSKELADKNIRVNAIRPGLIETEIHASGGEPGRAHRLGALVPMKRPGKANEVAEAIFWLCTDAASYTTGAILNVTGGR